MTNTHTRTIFTNDVILEFNGRRSTPCVTESGECFVVSRTRVFDDGEAFEVEHVTDINVFATEAEAEEWVARTYRGHGDSVIKYVYTVNCRNVRA